jgi:hypothetical protein
MKTNDLFDRVDAKKLNETLSKTFGQKLDLESYTLPQLEDARNKLRTQIYTYKQKANFNETVNNETFTKTQWMLDTINKEIASRIDESTQRVDEFWGLLARGAVAALPHLARMFGTVGRGAAAGARAAAPAAGAAVKGGAEIAAKNAHKLALADIMYQAWDHVEPLVKDLGDVHEVFKDADEYIQAIKKYAPSIAAMVATTDLAALGTLAATYALPIGLVIVLAWGGKKLWDQFTTAEKQPQGKPALNMSEDEGGDSLRSEVTQILRRFDQNMNEIGGYGDPNYDKVIKLLQQGEVEAAVEEVSYSYADKDGGEIRYMDDYLQDLAADFEALVPPEPDTYPDEGGETDDGYALASAGFGSDEDYGDYGQDESVETEAGYFGGGGSYDRNWSFSRRNREDDWDEGNTEPPNNFAIYINGKKWKVFQGQGTYADDNREMAQLRRLQDMCRKKSEQTGKKWEVSRTGEAATESIQMEKAPPGDKYERMVKHIKKGYAKDGELTDKERSIAYATAWKHKNKSESTETGDNMNQVRESATDKASAIVTAKSMVDRITRWIEELSGMENDQLLSLGDDIRDEFGQQEAKAFLSQVAPAIQQALQNLKATRETMANGVRSLSGEGAPADMIGAEPEGDMAADTGSIDDLAPPADAGADMAADAEAPADDFAAAEPAAGGAEEAGRAKRESIEQQNRLLKVLAG